jgi:phosphoribosyl-AMP cyclohydrolase
MKFIKKLKFDADGLIPAIIQDYKDGTVLMMAWMNRKSLEQSIKCSRTCFWSRSRKKLWMKGEESGNFQLIKEVRYDCDADALLFKVKQSGGASCHKGYRSCFFNKALKNGNSSIVEKRVFDPKKIYFSRKG